MVNANLLVFAGRRLMLRVIEVVSWFFQSNHLLSVETKGSFSKDPRSSSINCLFSCSCPILWQRLFSGGLFLHDGFFSWTRFYWAGHIAPNNLVELHPVVGYQPHVIIDGAGTYQRYGARLICDCYGMYPTQIPCILSPTSWVYAVPNGYLRYNSCR